MDELLKNTDIIVPVADPAKIAKGTIVRRINTSKDQQGCFTNFDDQGGMITMAFDHALALRAVRRRLRTLASYSSAPLLLLAPEFTLRQGRRVYELMLERPVEACAFESWLRALRCLELVETAEGGADRSEDRYRLRAREPAWMEPAW